MPPFEGMSQPGKPIVTVTACCALVLAHVVAPLAAESENSQRQLCLMPGAILYSVELQRYASGLFLHWGHAHLIWAVISLSLKGLALEPHVGSLSFLKLLGFLALLSTTVTVMMSFSMSNIFGDSNWVKQCYFGVVRYPPPPHLCPAAPCIRFLSARLTLSVWGPVCGLCLLTGTTPDADVVCAQAGSPCHQAR